MIQSLLLLFQRIQHFLIRYIINVKQFTEKQTFKYLWLLPSTGKGGRAGHVSLSYRKQNGQTTLKSCGGTGAQPAKNGKGGKGEKCYGIKRKISIKSHRSKIIGHLLTFTSAFSRPKTWHKRKRRTKATAASKEQRFRLAKQLLCTWSKHNQVSSHFYFILLVSPVIGRVTATAWRQLLRARNSPFPHTPGTTSPTLLRTVWGFFNVPQNSYMQGLWDGAYGFIVLIRED